MLPSGNMRFASVSDRAGNVTSAASPPVRIDRTPPLTTAAGPTGWTNAAVTIMLSAVDNLSGVDATHYAVDGGATQTGTVVPIADEGVHHVAYWSVDAAGNAEAFRSVDVLIDRTAPTIFHTIAPAPNAAGWNRGDVSVSFQCADALSLVAFCTPTQLLLGEGAALPVAGTARDNAGNVAHDTALVSIDRTAPAISAARDRAPNAAGWYRDDVLVGFTCSDLLSGIASCPAPVRVGEGRAQTASGTARDAAGNTATASASGLNVDKTAPTVTYAGNASPYGLEQNVSITCRAADALSGVASSTCADVTGPAWSFGTGTVSRSATATDIAGNTGAGSVSFVVGVTPGGLCAITVQFVESSAKYRALSPNQQHGADGLTNAVCQKLTEILPRLSPSQKHVMVNAYEAGVDAIVHVGYLTSAQASTLKGFADLL